MAWKQVKVEDQRKMFIETVLEGSNFSAICRQFDISRQAGYKWLNRFNEEGYSGLIDRSKAPHTQPNIIDECYEKIVLELRIKFPKLGPKKIYAKLLEINPLENWPCPTSISNILDRNGLTVKRKFRKRVAANTPSAFNGEEPNEVWCMDFKGTLKTLDNNKYDPFTLTDSSSRYLLKCLILKRNNFEYVWSTLDATFREYGLPQYILSDNGPPFATIGAGRLSRLSINLIKAGVKPLWIEPGKPQQNGRHERMHGIMESDIGSPAANSKTELQSKLMNFQNYYNFDRPHGALGQKPPGKIFTKSERQWNGRFRDPEYNQDYEVRKVQKCGTINYKGKRIFIGETFHQEKVGIKEEDELRVYFGDILLGVINDSQLRFRRL